MGNKHWQQQGRAGEAGYRSTHLRLLAVGSLCALVAACSGDKETAAQQQSIEQAKGVPVTAQPAEQGPIAAPIVAPPEDESASAEEELIEGVSPDAVQEDESQQPALNLSYQPDTDDEHMNGEGLPAQNRLPDMFEQDKAGRKIKVSGGVMRDKENEELIDSIQGAELKFQISTP
jgi:hypothetical protein